MPQTSTSHVSTRLLGSDSPHCAKLLELMNRISNCESEQLLLHVANCGNLDTRLYKRIELDESSIVSSDRAISNCLRDLTRYTNRNSEEERFPIECNKFLTLKFLKTPLRFVAPKDLKISVEGLQIKDHIEDLGFKQRKASLYTQPSKILEIKKRRANYLRNVEEFKGKYDPVEEILYDMNTRTYFRKKQKYLLSNFNQEQDTMETRWFLEQQIRDNQGVHTDELQRLVQLNRQINTHWFDRCKTEKAKQDLRTVEDDEKEYKEKLKAFKQRKHEIEVERTNLLPIYQREKHFENKHLWWIAEEYGRLPEVTERMYTAQTLKYKNAQILNSCILDKLSILTNLEVALNKEIRQHKWKRMLYNSERRSRRRNPESDIKRSRNHKGRSDKSTQVFDYANFNSNRKVKDDKAIQTTRNKRFDRVTFANTSESLGRDLANEALMELTSDYVKDQIISFRDEFEEENRNHMNELNTNMEGDHKVDITITQIEPSRANNIHEDNSVKSLDNIWREASIVVNELFNGKSGCLGDENTTNKDENIMDEQIAIGHLSAMEAYRNLKF